MWLHLVYGKLAWVTLQVMSCAQDWRICVDMHVGTQPVIVLNMSE